MPHAEGKITIGSFYHEVIVIVHEAVSVTEPVIAFVDEGEYFEKYLPVPAIFEYSFFIVAPISDVIHRARVFYA